MILSRHDSVSCPVGDFSRPATCNFQPATSNSPLYNSAMSDASESPTIAPTLKPIDMHVHVVGNGSGNSGCWLHVRNWHRPMAAMMLKHIGLPSGALKGDLENLYIQRLLDLVRTSSLGAIVILAQDEVYDEHGKKMENVGSHYVTNDYVLYL